MSYKYFLIDDSDYDAGSQVLVRTQKDYTKPQIEKLVDEWIEKLVYVEADISNALQNIEHKLRRVITKHFENEKFENLEELLLSKKDRGKDTQRNILKNIEEVKKAEKEKDIQSYQFYVNGLAQSAGEIVIEEAGIKFPWSSSYNFDELEIWVGLLEKWNIEFNSEELLERREKFYNLASSYEGLNLIELEESVHLYGNDSKTNRIPSIMHEYGYNDNKDVW